MKITVWCPFHTPSLERCNPFNFHKCTFSTEPIRPCKIFKARTNFGIFTIKFQGTKVWNSIEDDTKLLSLSKFTKKMKTGFPAKLLTAKYKFIPCMLQSYIFVFLCAFLYCLLVVSFMCVCLCVCVFFCYVWWQDPADVYCIWHQNNNVKVSSLSTLLKRFFYKLLHFWTQLRWRSCFERLIQIEMGELVIEILNS